MPGSTELAHGGIDAYGTIDGPVPSITWRYYGTASTWEDVVSYFDGEMRARGWAPGGGSPGVVYSLDEEFPGGVRGWDKGDRILRLGHRRFVANDTVGFHTYYSVNLIGRAVTCCRSAAP
jgi:hypothetical protein